MTEKEQQFNQWFDQYANGVKVFEEVDMKQAYLQGRAELEEENTKLKEKLKPENCLKLLAKEGYIKFTSEQLTKAKEIIKTFLGFAETFGYSPSMDKFISDTEQFLSEVEK